MSNKKCSSYYTKSIILNIESGSYLSSQEATLQVLSAQAVFTTVFGMGTGGILPPGHRKIFYNFPFTSFSWKMYKPFLVLGLYPENCINDIKPIVYFLWLNFKLNLKSIFRKSPRPISNARLHLLPNFYLHPINLVICKGTY